MKRTIIVCDNCGKEIISEGYAVSVTMRYIISGNSTADFCISCAQEAFAEALSQLPDERFDAWVVSQLRQREHAA